MVLLENDKLFASSRNLAFGVVSNVGAELLLNPKIGGLCINKIFNFGPIRARPTISGIPPNKILQCVPKCLPQNR